MNKNPLISALITFSLLALPLNGQAALTPKEELGKFIFFDTNLSSPPGQSCASCHDPATGFADPDQFLPTSEGVVAGRFGRRNAPTITYAGFAPDFFINPDGSSARGGQFHDGRALNLVEQAKDPFLNPNEMNSDIKTVMSKICSSAYATLFRQVYGSRSCKTTSTAYALAADAIAAFERSSELSKFTSKFDAVKLGLATFTEQENNGKRLFESICFVCHEPASLFTDFTYHNLGLPKNTGFPFSTMDQTFVDRGLGEITRNSLNDGKFKVPSLRNVALTAPYMHNGVLPTLKDVVHFYNTRDIPGVWPPPEVQHDNIAQNRLMGNMDLTSAQEDDIVAFLRTLTDGYLQ